MFSPDRFLQAWEQHYETALTELKAGRKRSHWMWFIYPQLAGLGSSSMAAYYALSNLADARSFLQHPVLGAGLMQISSVLLSLPGNDALAVFGSPDNLKLRSSMTLFAEAAPSETVFTQVLDKYFGGVKDERTLEMR